MKYTDTNEPGKREGAGRREGHGENTPTLGGQCQDPVKACAAVELCHARYCGRPAYVLWTHTHGHTHGRTHTHTQHNDWNKLGVIL